MKMGNFTSSPHCKSYSHDGSLNRVPGSLASNSSPQRHTDSSLYLLSLKVPGDSAVCKHSTFLLLKSIDLHAVLQS